MSKLQALDTFAAANVAAAYDNTNADITYSPGGAITKLMIVSNFNAAVNLSFNGGTSDHMVIPAGDFSMVLDLDRGDDFPGPICIKRNSGAVGSGNMYLTAWIRSRRAD